MADEERRPEDEDADTTELDRAGEDVKRRTTRWLRDAERRRELLRSSLAEQERRLITFGLQGRRFAAALAAVGRIGRVPPITEVPRTPSFIRGICNLKGDIITIIDLPEALGEPEVGEAPCGLLVLEDETRRIGLLTTDIPDIISVPEKSMRPAPATCGALAPLLEGVLEMAGEMVAILDAFRVFEFLGRELDAS